MEYMPDVRRFMFDERRDPMGSGSAPGLLETRRDGSAAAGFGRGSRGWSRRDAEAACRRLGRERAGRSWSLAEGLGRRGGGMPMLSLDEARDTGSGVRLSWEAAGRRGLGTGRRDGRGMPLGRAAGRSSILSGFEAGTRCRGCRGSFCWGLGMSCQSFCLARSVSS